MKRFELCPEGNCVILETAILIEGIQKDLHQLIGDNDLHDLKNISRNIDEIEGILKEYISNKTIIDNSFLDKKSYIILLLLKRLHFDGFINGEIYNLENKLEQLFHKLNNL